MTNYITPQQFEKEYVKYAFEKVNSKIYRYKQIISTIRQPQHNDNYAYQNGNRQINLSSNITIFEPQFITQRQIINNIYLNFDPEFWNDMVFI
jgi:hypothetical protein